MTASFEAGRSELEEPARSARPGTGWHRHIPCLTLKEEGERIRRTVRLEERVLPNLVLPCLRLEISLSRSVRPKRIARRTRWRLEPRRIWGAQVTRSAWRFWPSPGRETTTGATSGDGPNKLVPCLPRPSPRSVARGSTAQESAPTPCPSCSTLRPHREKSSTGSTGSPHDFCGKITGTYRPSFKQSLCRPTKRRSLRLSLRDWLGTTESGERFAPGGPASRWEWQPAPRCSACQSWAPLRA